MFNNNLKRNHAKQEKCNAAIKQTSIASAASWQIIGGPFNMSTPWSISKYANGCYEHIGRTQED